MPLASWKIVGWWRAATHFINLIFHQQTFFLFHKVKATFKKSRFHDMKDIKKNITAECNVVPLDAIIHCSVQT
jgi:hypothetical protein